MIQKYFDASVFSNENRKKLENLIGILKKGKIKTDNDNAIPKKYESLLFTLGITLLFEKNKFWYTLHGERCEDLFVIGSEGSSVAWSDNGPEAEKIIIRTLVLYLYDFKNKKSFVQESMQKVSLDDFDKENSINLVFSDVKDPIFINFYYENYNNEFESCIWLKDAK